MKKLASKEGIDLEKLDTEVKEVSLDDDSEDCSSGQESSQEGCSGSKKSAPQNDESYNMGGANFTAKKHRTENDLLPDREIQAVASGIDVLYIGFYVDVNEKVLSLLEAWKQVAVHQRQSGRSTLVPLDIGDYTFNLSAEKEGVYAYVLSNSDLRIKVSKEEGSHPSVYVRLKSLFILENGAYEAVGLVRSFVSSNFGEIEQEKVSRVEIYCDIVGASLTQEDEDFFVSRARDCNICKKDGKFTGFTFGKGNPIKAKIYNKTKEIKVSHKEYMYDMWDGVEEGDTVWRVEFEFDRKLLREFSVESFDDFFLVAGDIWRYLTEDWLKVREDSKDHLPPHTLTLLWEVVQSVREFFGPVTGKVREKKHSCDIDGLVSQILGCFTSIGAIRLSEGLSFSKNSLRKEIDFEIDKQLAGVDGDGELTSSDISALSEVGFYQEAYRKEVELV